MCLIRVKEDDDYSVPPRVVRRERRRSPPSPQRSARVSRTYYQDRQADIERTYIIQQAPPPAPSQSALPVASEPAFGPEPVHMRPPTPPPAVVEPVTHSHYVEVSPDSASDSESGSSADDLRSRRTNKSRRSEPRSEVRYRESDFRAERRYEVPRRDDYNSYRYVRAPPDRHGRPDRLDEPGMHRSTSLRAGTSGNHLDDPRASRGSYRREKVIIVNEDGRKTTEYRRG